jgi:ribose 5-phosphate isomerase B
MKIGFGSDQKGYELKLEIIKELESHGYKVVDVGCHSTQPVDYPDFAKEVALGVAAGKFDYGILICGTGQGMNIAANKIKGVRAAVCYDILPAILSREHNNANILCTGAWLITPELAKRMVIAWVEMGFAGGKHEAKVKKIAALETLGV